MRLSGRGRVAVLAVGVVLAAACSAPAVDVLRPSAPAAGTGGIPGGSPAATPSTSLPADLLVAQRARCSPDLTPGWLQRENDRPGMTPTRTSAAPAAHVYLDTVSAVCGQVVHAAVSAPAGVYRLSIVRIGWYGGRGGRRVALSPVLRAAPQPDAPGSDAGGSPAWRASASLRIAPGWPPGYYLVQLAIGPRVLATAPLVVRAPQGAPRAGELFVVSAMTWTAYSTYGGRSLYKDDRLRGRAATARRARIVSVARPVEGPATTKVFLESGGAVRAVEHAGVDLDYVADTDVDATPSLLAGRSAVLTGSHTEYVTGRIYDAFEAARDAGTNLAFLGGNQFYWQARLGRDLAGDPLTMTVYRRPEDDPVAVAQPGLATTRWRSAPLRRPEARLLGAEYSHLGVVVPLVVQAAPRWLGWRAREIIAGGAASEVDSFVPGVSPPGTQILAAGAATDQGTEVTPTVTYYVADSGAGVFDAGNLYLGCSTLGACGNVPCRPRRPRSGTGPSSTWCGPSGAPRFGVGAPVRRRAAVPTSPPAPHRYGITGVGTTVAA